ELKNSVARVDAANKIAGATQYLADMDFGCDVLHAVTVRSSRARARIVKRNIPVLPQGYYIVDHSDVRGKQTMQMIIDDWPVFASSEVLFIGQTILLVVGTDLNVVHSLARQVSFEYEDLPAVLTIEDSKSLLGGAIHGTDNIFASYTAGYGDVDEALSRASSVIEMSYYTPHQEHLYMEVNGTVGRWEVGDDGVGRVALYCSTQCPFYVRHSVAPVLGCKESELKVVAPPIGGGFGGKEHYADVVASTVAVAVQKLKRTVSLFLDRQEDLAFSVKRQPALITSKTALDADGNILGIDIVTDMDGGAFEACSRIIMQRATFTASGVYTVPSIRVLGRVYATNRPPSCAFRGFGAPQAIFGIERTFDNIARTLKVNPLELRQKYLIKQGDQTITGGRFHDPIILDQLITWALDASDYRSKHHSYSLSPTKGDALKGIGISLFLHGCAFTGSGERDIIKAKLRLEKRGNRVRICTSNTEIGQGLHTTFKKIAAKELGIALENIEVAPYDTTQIPDTGPTVASRSIMIVGYLVQEAAKKMRARFNEDSFDIIQDYAHPDHLIAWDPTTFRGDAYPCYGLGVNVVEVEVDPVTYEVSVKNAWGVFDAGYTIDQKIVEGQIKGGMVQALGWDFLEKLEQKEGRFLQVKMADYMVPTTLDVPRLHSHTIDQPYRYGPSGAKGVGEITFDGAAAALASAVENAVQTHFTKIPILPENIAEVL
ncbi:MAG: xanthine dehydrogenase family protein molybdopterin-binding subunit, partial [Treponemataceae bacterium]